MKCPPTRRMPEIVVPIASIQHPKILKAGMAATAVVMLGLVAHFNRVPTAEDLCVSTLHAEMVAGTYSAVPDRAAFAARRLCTERRRPAIGPWYRYKRV